MGETTIAELAEARLAQIRAEASVKAIASSARGIAALADPVRVRFDPKPLPQHVSKRRRRLRGQQEGLVRWWHVACHLRAAGQFKIAAMYGKIARDDAQA